MNFHVEAVVVKEALFASPEVVLTGSGTSVKLGDQIEILAARAAPGTTYHPVKTRVVVSRIDGEYVIGTPAPFYTLVSEEIARGDIGKLVEK